MYKLPHEQNRLSSNERIKTAMINNFKDNIKQCTTCDTAVWINDKIKEKVDSGYTKDVQCSDCIIKTKRFKSKNQSVKNSKDFLKENKSQIKSKIQENINRLESRKLEHSHSAISATTDTSYQNKKDSNTSFNFQKKLKMLNQRTRQFMTNWELENQNANKESRDKNRDNPSMVNRNEFDYDSGAMRIDSRMTDNTDISSINFNPDTRNENEDWFFNQFRQAFNDRISNNKKDNDINISQNNKSVQDNKDIHFQEANFKKKNIQVQKTELEKIQEEKNRNFVKDRLYKEFIDKKKQQEEIEAEKARIAQNEKNKKNKEILKRMKEGPKLPSQLSKSASRNQIQEEEDQNESKLSNQSKRLQTKENKISSGSKDNINLAVRNNRFKVNTSSKKLNLDPENAAYIDKDKLKQSFRQMKDNENNNSSNQTSKSPDKQKLINRTSSNEEESPKFNVSLSSNKLSKNKIKIPMKSPNQNIKSNNMSTLSRESNSLSKGSILNLKESMISNRQDSFVSDNDMMFNTKKSKEMYLRNKFIRDQINNKINGTENARKLASNSTSLRNSIFNSKNNSRESSAEKNLNFKSGLQTLRNNSTKKVLSNSVNKTIQNARNRSTDKLDVKGVKINQVQSKLNSNKFNKNNNKVNSSVDKANQNLKMRKNELKNMINISIEAKSKSRSPDKEKEKEKDKYDRYKSSPKNKSKLMGKYLQKNLDSEQKELSPKKSAFHNSDDQIDRDINLEKDRIKEMELMQITDQNRLFELNKKLFQELRTEIDDEDNEKSDTEDQKQELKNNLQFVQENGVNFVSQTNFQKDSMVENADANPNEDSKLSNWERKPAKCKMLQMDGSSQEGQMQNGKYHGQGVYKYKNGHVQAGEWKMGYQNGKGKLIYKDGSRYQGDFKNGQRAGTGTMIWKDTRHRYEGNFEKDKKHGYGKERQSNGDVQQGQFKHGKKEGKGEQIWSSQTQYKGDQKNNKMDGQGILFWPTTKRRQEGQMHLNMRHGIGTFSWADGTCQQGGFLRDRRYGFGLIKQPDGRVFEGEWLNDHKHGCSHLRQPDGTVQETWYFNSKECSKTAFEQMKNENANYSIIIESARNTATDIKKVLDRSMSQDQFKDSFISMSRSFIK